jgi:site-specific recombinase XerD
MTTDNDITAALSALSKTEPTDLSPRHRALLEKIRMESLSAHSERAYKTDVRLFQRWHTIVFDCPLPSEVTVEVVMAFVLDLFLGATPAVLEQLATSGARKTTTVVAYNTIVRMLRSLGRYHVLQGKPDPTKNVAVRRLLKDFRRNPAINTTPRKLLPIDADVLRRMLATQVSPLADVRDRALLTMAWNTGDRRVSELVQSNVEDVYAHGPDAATREPSWYELHVPRQKNDREGQGMVVPIRGEAAAALGHLVILLRAQGITEGALFRRLDLPGRYGTRLTADGIRKRIIKRRLHLAGHDPERYSTHSLRAGWITTAAECGYSDRQIAALTGHRDQRSLDAYVRARRQRLSDISDLIHRARQPDEQND